MKTKTTTSKSSIPSQASQSSSSVPYPAESSAPVRRTATAQEISARAHKIWERNGSPAGRDLEFWFEAERQLGAAAGRQAKQEDAFADTEVIFDENNEANSPVDREIEGKSEAPDRRSETAL
jgi:hypothetical protein